MLWTRLSTKQPHVSNNYIIMPFKILIHLNLDHLCNKVCSNICVKFIRILLFTIFFYYIYIIFWGKLKFKTKMKKIRKNRVTSHCRGYNASLCFCIYRVPTIIIIKPIIIIIYTNIYASCQLFQNFPPEGSSVQVCAHCLGRCYGKSYETSLLRLCYAPLLYRSMDLHLCRVLRVVSCLFIDTAKA